LVVGVNKEALAKRSLGVERLQAISSALERCTECVYWEELQQRLSTYEEALGKLHEAIFRVDFHAKEHPVTIISAVPEFKYSRVYS